MHRCENHLIEILPPPDRRHLLALCEPVELMPSEVLCEAGTAMLHVFFPVDGFVCLTASIDGHPGLEVGMVGREGVLGAPLSLGVPASPMNALVQGAGSAWRIGSNDFVAELRRNASLRQGIDRYLYVRLVQLASAATCLRYHQLGPRLARWLLMGQDRAHSDRFHATHEALAGMLGVRRVGVTVAAGALQRAGLISYRRGEVKVLDRAGLEGAACSCYATDRQIYARHLH